MSVKRLNIPGVILVDTRKIGRKPRSGPIKDSEQLDSAIKTIRHFKENGIAPYEGAQVFTMENLKTNYPELAKKKTVFFSMLQYIKQAVKADGMTGKLAVIARGGKIYLANAKD